MRRQNARILSNNVLDGESQLPAHISSRFPTGSAAQPRALYVSGAPRLSTKATTESLGPRSHILGVIHAFESMGIDIDRFIVGDTVPDSLHAAGSEKRMGSSRARVAAADAARLMYRSKSRRSLARAAASRPYAFVYERYALMQELGSVVRDRRTPWVLEVNALLAIEATTERKATTSHRLAAAFEKRTLESADLIVAVTDQLADAVATEYGIARSKILTIENGVDTTCRAPSANSAQAAPTLGFLGSLYSWQRLDELLDAMTAPKNTDWRLRVAGTGPEYSALKAQVERLGLAERVEFLGRVHPDDVSDFLATVDLCYAGHGSSQGVYFSPLKLWEYLAAGRPVLASAHETTLRLESEGFAVRCFASKNDLAGALTASSMERSSTLELAQSRQQEVWAKYSWKARVAPLVARLGADA
ncbi:glycosyltransferase [Microbacterium sp. NPDC076911]|uniref:glycosyltransferase n=1 Tax=Microbacterium sp. NPDC076911 TaxID=3154958 RepID=UPI0034301661